MLIPVIYANGSHDLVKDFYLNYLISTEKIDQFKRNSGWVSISADNVRGKKEIIEYSGPERRISLNSTESEKAETDIEFERVFPSDKE